MASKIKDLQDRAAAVAAELDELHQLEEQLDMALWRLVDVTEGAAALAAALVRAQPQGSGEALALWEALWRLSEEALKS